MLAKLDVAYVLAGHSERGSCSVRPTRPSTSRSKPSTSRGMTPILCVGETLEEREAGITEAKVTARSRPGWPVCPATRSAGWSSRTSRSGPSAPVARQPEDAQAVCATVRPTVAELAGPGPAATVRIQYGGSVKADNAAELMACPDVDGALVGGASLEPTRSRGSSATATAPERRRPGLVDNRYGASRVTVATCVLSRGSAGGRRVEAPHRLGTGCVTMWRQADVMPAQATGAWDDTRHRIRVSWTSLLSSAPFTGARCELRGVRTPQGESP